MAADLLWCDAESIINLNERCVASLYLLINKNNKAAAGVEIVFGLDFSFAKEAI